MPMGIEMMADEVISRIYDSFHPGIRLSFATWITEQSSSLTLKVKQPWLYQTQMAKARDSSINRQLPPLPLLYQMVSIQHL